MMIETNITSEEYASTGLPPAIEDSDLYREFAFESREHLESVEEKILMLEQNPDRMELLDEIFRSFHSVKGAAGFLNLVGVHRLAHDTETLLDRCRKGRLKLSGSVADLCLQSADCLKQMLINLEQATEAAGPPPETFQKVIFGPIRQAILDYLEHSDAIEISPVAKESAPTQGSSLNRSPNDFIETNQPKRIGELLVEQGDITAEQLSKALDLQGAPIGQILVETGAISSERLEKTLDKQRDECGSAREPARSIKVDVAKIDHLVNLAGELSAIEARIKQMISGGIDNRIIEKNISQIGRITQEIQECSMALRMMPIRQTFQKMHRLVRDASRKANKKANLRITGEDVEIDKAAVEQMGDPLMHLIRNALDHGIESPEVRVAQGKPETGTVELGAYCIGNEIMICVKDDGKGLDLQKIWQKAIELGLAKKDSSPLPSEVRRLIFAPGLTTASAVTDTFGRGVGMDVVKTNVTKLKGRVDIETEPGKGSTFTITLPLTPLVRPLNKISH